MVEVCGATVNEPHRLKTWPWTVTVTPVSAMGWSVVLSRRMALVSAPPVRWTPMNCATWPSQGTGTLGLVRSVSVYPTETLNPAQLHGGLAIGVPVGVGVGSGGVLPRPTPLKV